MANFDAQTTMTALNATGEVLAAWNAEPIELILAGGTAGLLGHLLSANRTTGDCDVIWMGSQGAWDEVQIWHRGDRPV